MRLLYLLFLLLNTFLTFPDFKKSAASLDRKRLGKQRVEALQVLNLVMSLQYLGTHYSNPLLSDPYGWERWRHQVISRYKSDPGKPQLRPSNSRMLNQIDNTSDTTEIKIGFATHPVILMWLGHPESLQMYINAHIDEWVARGYNNNMKRYPDIEVLAPKWVFDPELHRTHRINLFYKEFVEYQKRFEPYFGLNSYELLCKCLKPISSKVPDHATLLFNYAEYKILSESEASEGDLKVSFKVERPAYLYLPDFEKPAREGYVGYFWPYTSRLGKGNDGTDDSQQRYR